MTTQFWSTAVNHSGDAGFRAWGLELSTKLAAAGLVQTADSGQINWTTDTRPAINTNGGYEVWRFNDTQQTAAPIFIKIFYGTGAVDDRPRIQIQLGTSSDGAGTLGGTTTLARTVSASEGSATGGTLYNSYLCVAEGYFGLVWKAGAATAGYSFAGWAICRSVDSDGIPDEKGCVLLYHSASLHSGTNGANQSVRFEATAVAYTVHTTPGMAFIPGAQPASLVDGVDFQAYLMWMITPKVTPVFGLCVMFVSEVAEGVSFTTTLVGTTSRTYIQVGLQLGQHFSAAAPSSMGTCILWE